MAGRLCLALVVGIAGLASVPVAAGAVVLPDCPDLEPAAALSDGQSAIGYTVRSGEAVESFDVTILGVVPDGIAPGRDMIVVDTSGPVIDAGGGVSAGMSGSPVYTLGGDLIGAISFSLSSGASSIAGVTPAADMLDLVSQSTVATATTASLDRSARVAIARQAGVATSSVPVSMSRLPLPLAVSGGLLAPHRAALGRLGDRIGQPLVITSGSSAHAAIEPTATLAAGDSVSAMLSYGDVSIGATGTATYVCGGAALAFGHPFAFSGPTTLGANRARIVAIVDGSSEGPFKLANIGDPVGRFDIDRLSGVRASIGESIPTVPITQTTRALDTGRTRAGARSDVVVGNGFTDLFFPEIVVTHALSNFDSTFDQVSAGSSRVSYTIRGTRKSGAAWKLKSSNRWISGGDISGISLLSLLFDLEILRTQDFADVDFSSVNVSIDAERTIRRYVFKRVLWSRAGGPFRNVKKLRVHPRDWIRARARLHASDGGPDRVVTMWFRAPRHGHGKIVLYGGGEFLEAFDDGIFFFGGEGAGLTSGQRRARPLSHTCPSGGCDQAPKNFKQLLTQLGKPSKNDSLYGAVWFKRKKTRRVLPKVVVGYDSVKVGVVPRRRRLPR